jgi:hypothetical protein
MGKLSGLLDSDSYNRRMFGFLFRQAIRPVGGPTHADVAGRIDIAVSEVDRRVEELQISCAAMWEILRDRFGMTDEQLVDKINEIDLRDGQKDGKMQPQNQDCPSCGKHLLIRQRDVCSWCGHRLTEQPFG